MKIVRRKAERSFATNKGNYIMQQQQRMQRILWWYVVTAM